MSRYGVERPSRAKSWGSASMKAIAAEPLGAARRVSDATPHLAAAEMR